MHYHKSYKKLSSISSDDVISFHIVILNFITNMSLARDSCMRKMCDVILIIINKVTKHATYVSIIINLKVDEFINIL